MDSTRNFLVACLRALQSAVIAAVIVAAAGCSSVPVSSTNGEATAMAELRTMKLQILGREELREALLNHSLSGPSGPPILWSDFSVFKQGGRYLHFGHRNVVTTGSYVIRGSWVCVRQAEQPENCFVLGRDGRGVFFSKSLRPDSGPPTMVELRPWH